MSSYLTSHVVVAINRLSTKLVEPLNCAYQFSVLVERGGVDRASLNGVFSSVTVEHLVGVNVLGRQHWH